MKYNLYFHTFYGAFNIMGLPEKKLDVVLNAYKKGKSDFTISGRKYQIENLNTIQVFTHDVDSDPKEIYANAHKYGIAKDNLIGYHIPPDGLEKLGENVTDEILGDVEFGQERNEIEKESNSFIAHSDSMKGLNLQAIKNKLKLEVSENLKNAFLDLKMILNPRSLLFNEFISNSARFNSNKSRKGVITHENFTLAENQIIEGLLSLIDNMKEEDIDRDII